MKKDQTHREPEGWPDLLKGVLADAQALAGKMHQVREVLPPVQSGMAVRLQEFEDTLRELLGDETVQRLLKQP